MKVDSAVPAARVCTLPSKAERTQMNANVVIVYNGEQVSVPKEVADFLEQDRKREQAQEKQDARHLSKSEFETVPSGSDCVKRPVEDAVLRNLRLENLRGAIAELDVQGQNLLSLRYSGELTMEEIGQIYGISRMAVSKRLKKLHKKLESSVS
jgi:RNA polymerase sigma factor (sigma-70 family)